MEEDMEIVDNPKALSGKSEKFSEQSAGVKESYTLPYVITISYGLFSYSISLITY